MSTFNTGAIAVACDILLETRKKEQVESWLLEYGLHRKVQISDDLSETLFNLKGLAIEMPDLIVQTDKGKKALSRVVVEMLFNYADLPTPVPHLWEKLERYLALDGYTLNRKVVDTSFKEYVYYDGISPTLPKSAEAEEALSNLETLLSEFEFEVAEKHFNIARDNLLGGDWEAANSQCRSFLEAVTNSIADHLYYEEAKDLKSGLEKRRLLAKKGFLSTDKHEFGEGGGHAFLPGLAKLLHPDGAHPGISNKSDALFRYQIVTCTAQWLLSRLSGATTKKRDINDQ